MELVELAQRPTAVVRGLVAEEQIAGFLGGVFGEVMGVLAAEGLQPAGMPFGCYVPTPDGFEIEAGFPTAVPVAPAGRVVPAAIPGGTAVRVLHKGSYGEVAAAYHAAEAWLADNGYESTGPPWEEYLDGPEVPEPRTLVHFPCRRV